MRLLPVAALLIGSALLAVHDSIGADGPALPALALFTFAVSAFREPLR